MGFPEEPGRGKEQFQDAGEKEGGRKEEEACVTKRFQSFRQWQKNNNSLWSELSELETGKGEAQEEAVKAFPPVALGHYSLSLEQMLITSRPSKQKSSQQA